jgi:hypothetical protein
MTNEQYRACLDKLGLSARGLAPILGVSVRASQRYAVDDAIPGPVARLVRLMVDRGIKPELVRELD